MTHHEHVEVFVDGVDGERARRVGGGRQDVGLAANPDDVGRVSAAGAFGVIGVNRAAFEGADGILEVAGFVEGVGVDGDLDVEFIGDTEATIDGGRGACPSLREA